MHFTFLCTKKKVAPRVNLVHTLKSGKLTPVLLEHLVFGGILPSYLLSYSLTFFYSQTYTKFAFESQSVGVLRESFHHHLLKAWPETCVLLER